MTKNELAENNLGLVYACANRFKGRGVEYEDLCGAGCIGLVKASKKFDESLGFAFSTYAVPVVLGEIKRLFRDGGVVKVSRSVKEKSRLVQAEKERIIRETGEEPTVAEIAENLSVSVPEAAELLLVSMPPLSLTSDEDTEKQLDVPVTGTEEKISDMLDLKRCINSLDENEKLLVKLRFFDGKTQSETSKILGLTQVQVSRKEKKILLEMRKQMSI